MKPVVPVHVFTGPVFSYNKTNVICHIHYFNPRNKVYLKNIYISKLRREVCSFYLANFPWLSKELLPVNSLSCLCKEKCHSIHMFHYVWSRWLHSFHKGLFFWGRSLLFIPSSDGVIRLTLCWLSTRWDWPSLSTVVLYVESYIRGWFKASIKYMAVNANNF